MKRSLVSPVKYARPSTTRRLAVLVLGTLAVFGAVTLPAGGAFAAVDTTAPTKPAQPVAQSITPINATIHTSGSTDNDQVAGYWVQRQVNGVWTDWSSTNLNTDIVYLLPLTPGTTYTVALVAFDPSGNRSPRSDPLTFTTTSQPAPTCRVMLQVLSTQTYMMTSIIENLTVAIISNWTVTFTMPAVQTMNGIANATLARSGDAATAAPAPNTAHISPGATVYFIFAATRPAGSPLPSGIAFNYPGAAPITCTMS
jgi:hypothetical protein